MVFFTAEGRLGGSDSHLQGAGFRGSDSRLQGAGLEGVLVRVCKASVAVAVRRSLNCSAVGGILGGSESLPFGSGSLNDTYSGSLAWPLLPQNGLHSSGEIWFRPAGGFAQFKGFMKVFCLGTYPLRRSAFFRNSFHTGIRQLSFLHSCIRNPFY